MNDSSAIIGTVEIRVFGPDGKPKPIFQENRLFRWLIRSGLASTNFPKIPVLLGYWTTKKEIQII
jgi:hypothetical protein